MIISNGKNNYPENKFSFWEWSAPILQKPQEVIAKIKELKLQGRVIKSFYTVGMGYNWDADAIDETIYNTIDNSNISKKEAFPFLLKEIDLPRCAEIDEPFLIEFEDGDVLGIDYSEGSSVRMEFNTIPKDIQFGVNRRTFHPNVLFSSFIGRKIEAVEVTASTECDDFTCSHGIEIDEQDAYITKISFVCVNDKYWEHEKLEFTSYYDYGVVTARDCEGKELTIHAPDIKDVVKGFIGDETINLKNCHQFDD